MTEKIFSQLKEVFASPTLFRITQILEIRYLPVWQPVGYSQRQRCQTVKTRTKNILKNMAKQT